MLISKIELDENSRIPKYKQIVDSIVHNIANGNFRLGQKLPSINLMSEEYYLSRDTVEKSYNILKERKIITSIRGKGFYINKTQMISRMNVLFLVNKVSSYKMMIYNSFLNCMDKNSITDLFVYHCEEALFLNIMEKSYRAYDYYIIMPHFKNEESEYTEASREVISVVNNLPKDRLLILDNKINNLSGNHSEVYQDFSCDIYETLKEAINRIQLYRKIFLVYPKKSIYPYPKGILNGFLKFCLEFSIDYEVIEEVNKDITLKKGYLFVVIEDSDLVNLVTQTQDDNYGLGSDIGVISYNDTALKGLLGITVISTDFKNMGTLAAQMIHNGIKCKIRNPFKLINRKSM